MTEKPAVPPTTSWAAWLYVASSFFSAFGNSIATVVWPWLILRETGDATAAGVVSTAIAVPSVLIAVVGGQLIDTFGRKPMSIISDVISGVTVAALVLVGMITGELTMATFMVLGILGAVGDVPGQAARMALVGDVAEKSGKSAEWVAGIGQTVFGVSFLAGPAFAGILISWLPSTTVLWITAGCSFTAALLTFLLPLRSARHEHVEDTNPFKGAAGWKEIIAFAPIRLFAVVGMLSQVLVMPFLLVIMPAHFVSINDSTSMGLMWSAYALGMMLAGILMARLGTTNRARLWVIIMVLYTVAFACIPFLKITPIALFGMFLAGVGSGVQGPLATVIVTETISEKLRGRAFSLFSATGMLSAPIGLAITTLLLGWGVSIYVLAAAFAIVWAVIGVTSALRGVKILGTGRD